MKLPFPLPWFVARLICWLPKRLGYEATVGAVGGLRPPLFGVFLIRFRKLAQGEKPCKALKPRQLRPGETLETWKLP